MPRCDRADLRKKFSALIAVLLLSLVGTRVIYLGLGNPYSQAVYSGETSSVPNTEPPTVQIFSPENNKIFNADNVYLTFKASVGNSTATIGMWTDRGMWISAVYYKADWQENSSLVYSEGEKHMVTDFSHSLNLTGIPDGNHSIVISATESGTYFPNISSYYGFSIDGSSLVFFTIDTTPRLWVLSIENKTYDKSSISLNFTVSEPVSQITYSLDGQGNMTIGGNTTLAGLNNGEHSLTVYAEDNAGNIGASETVYFSVEVPAPSSTTVAVASGALIAVVGICLRVYFKRRKSGEHS